MPKSKHRSKSKQNSFGLRKKEKARKEYEARKNANKGNRWDESNYMINSTPIVSILRNIHRMEHENV